MPYPSLVFLTLFTWIACGLAGAGAGGAAWVDTTGMTGADCLQSGCHGVLHNQRYLHPPAMQGDCGICHMPENATAEPASQEGKTHPLRTRDATLELCSQCHRDMSLDRVAVHEPFRGACTACHNPHGGAVRYYLTAASAGDLCLGCHKDLLEGLARPHGPVTLKQCLSCHSAHSSDHAGLLARPPERMCLYCHSTFQRKMEEAASVHGPVRDQCTACHRPHGGNQAHLLVRPESNLCAECHEATLSRMKTTKFTHEAMIAEADCSKCHAPHWSAWPRLLGESSMSICFKCHLEAVKTEDGRMLAAVGAQVEAAKFKHGPVRQGDCTPCHTAHGGDDPRLMEKAFPQEFYADYSEDKYSLCFMCHDAALVEERAGTVTGFRNGDTNLHFEHVHREKGRSCRACHHEHASNQPFQLRESTPFGNQMLELKFGKTASGGNCLSGCHRPKGYDRVSPVSNAPVGIEKE